MDLLTYPVLHVDDDPSMTALVSRLVGNMGADCIALNDSTLAMDYIRAHEIRVVITDLDMPGLHGLELLQQIKRFDGGINVIVFTSLVSQSSVIQSLRRGASDCVFKPLRDPQLLVGAVQLAFENVDHWRNILRELYAAKHEHSILAHS